MEATDLGEGNHVADRGRLDRPLVGCVLPQGQVGTRAMIVPEVRAQAPAEMALAKDDDVVEELSPNGADHPLPSLTAKGGSWALGSSEIDGLACFEGRKS